MRRPLACIASGFARMGTNSMSKTPIAASMVRKKAGSCGAESVGGLPAISEAKFQRQVIELAHWFGFTVAHFRPGRVTRNGVEKYETAVGADGKGFPDLVLVNPGQQRIIFAELKTDKGRVTAPQSEWIHRLMACMAPGARHEVYLWRPSHWAEIEAALRADGG